MLAEVKTRIASMARRFRHEGWRETEFTYRIPAQPPSRGGIEAYHEFGYMKPELYAIAGTFTDMAIHQAYGEWIQAPTYSCGPIFNPFGTIPGFLSSKIVPHIESILKQARDGDLGEAPFLNYSRLTALVGFLSRIHTKEKYDSIAGENGFFGSGLNTANGLMAGLSRTLRDVSDDKDPDRLEAINRNNYPLSARFASYNIELLVPALDALGQVDFQLYAFRRFYPNYFEIQQDAGSEHLVLSSSGEDKFQSTMAEVKARYEANGQGLPPTTGCLALVNFGAGSAVHTLHNWHVQLAANIYRQQYMRFRTQT